MFFQELAEAKGYTNDIRYISVFNELFIYHFHRIKDFPLKLKKIVLADKVFINKTNFWSSTVNQGF